MAAESDHRGSPERLVTTASLTLVAEKQGEIKRPVRRSEDDSRLEIHGWSHGLVSRDAASGLPTGKRRHEPLVILKSIDETSLQLAKALLEEEVMRRWVLEVRPPGRSRKGKRPPSASDLLLDMSREAAIDEYLKRLKQAESKEERRYTIELENARVARIETEMPDNTDPESLFQQPREWVSFTYDRITWNWGAEAVSSEEIKDEETPDEATGVADNHRDVTPMPRSPMPLPYPKKGPRALVEFTLTIDSKGDVTKVEVKCIDPKIKKAEIKAWVERWLKDWCKKKWVRKWKFTPGISNGEAVAGTYREQVRFQD